MNYHIEEKQKKLFSLKDLPAGSYFRFNGKIYLKLDLAENMINVILKTRGLASAKVFVACCDDDVIGFFDDRNLMVELLEASITLVPVV